MKHKILTHLKQHGKISTIDAANQYGLFELDSIIKQIVLSGVDVFWSSEKREVRTDMGIAIVDVSVYTLVETKEDICDCAHNPRYFNLNEIGQQICTKCKKRIPRLEPDESI